MLMLLLDLEGISNIVRSAEGAVLPMAELMSTTMPLFSIYPGISCVVREDGSKSIPQ